MCSRASNTFFTLSVFTHWALSEFVGSNPPPESFFQQNTRLPAPRFYDCDRITTIAPDNVLIMLLCIRGLNIKAYGDIFLLHGNTIGECIPHFLTSIGYCVPEPEGFWARTMCNQSIHMLERNCRRCLELLPRGNVLHDSSRGQTEGALPD